MSGKVLVDNWTLQNAGEFLHDQHRGAVAQEISFTDSSDGVHYRDVSQDTVALSCICQLIQHIVLDEVLVVEAALAESWSDLPWIAQLARKGLIEARAFNEQADHWVRQREAIADELSACSPTIRQRHEQNKQDYAASGRSGDPMLSQVLWGGAGMLARAQFARVPHAPPPRRERLLLRSRLGAAVGGAQEALVRFIDTQQVKLYASTGLDGVFGTLRLPSIVVQVIQNASTASQLIPVAIQLRDQYGDLRGWLAEFQRALDAEDVTEVLARKKVLQSVSGNIDRLAGQHRDGVTSIQLGVDFQPKASLNIRALMDSAINRFGVHAQINRLVLTSPGRRAFEKLLRMLGVGSLERTSLIARDFYEFQART